MNAERFTLRWVGLLALFAALLAGMPLLVELLERNAACFGTETACHEMAEMLGHYGRSLILVLVVVPLLVTIAARALTIGVFTWAFPFALLMTAGSLPLLYALGGVDADSVDAVLDHGALLPFLFLLVLCVALSAESEEVEGNLWRMLMGLVAVATIFVISTAWLPGFALMPFAGQVAASIGFYAEAGHSALGLTMHLGQLANSCLLAFALAAAGMMMSARHARG